MPRPRPADEVAAKALRLFEALRFRDALDLIDVTARRTVTLGARRAF
jgi:hypothetical protein